MTYLDKNLINGEEIIYRTRKHFIIFLPPVILTVMMVIFLLSSNPYVRMLAFLPAIGAIFSWINEFLDYMTSEFAVTTKRIMMKEGFFVRHTNEARLTTLTNINTNQSLLGQLLNYGTVNINTFGGINDAFPEIPAPVTFQKHVQEQLDKIGR